MPCCAGTEDAAQPPFEGDEVLTVVLSKMLMLAADDKITDPTILRHIDRRSWALRCPRDTLMPLCA